MGRWENFKKYFFRNDKIGISIDFSQSGLTDEFFAKMLKKIDSAFDEMAVLEAGDIANKDEGRMVGHYWLRNPDMAPTDDVRNEITNAYAQAIALANDIRTGNIVGQSGKFKNIILIGIGGSSLCQQLLIESTQHGKSIRCYFLDNTDPDGIASVLQQLDGKLGETLVIVTSKSGSTPEPRNAMKEVANAYNNAGLMFPNHAVAITQTGSMLDKQAFNEKWLARLPMWEWVGGRTSMFSAVGVFPAAVVGIDTTMLISGAHDMDTTTRERSRNNPAMMLALAWYIATNGTGTHDMVIIPYKDSLSMFSKYMQQLIMESLGKMHDRDGNIVHQGITVYGNKGSTDQHSFIQQLRDGLKNFFITIITVLKPCARKQVAVDDDGMKSSDYLNGFALGTMAALSENGTKIIHISIDNLSAYGIGALIALYERTVGYYASMINVNAYNQPGVEAGKKAASDILKMEKQLIDFFNSNTKKKFSLEEISGHIGTDDMPLLFKILGYMSANGMILKTAGKTPFTSSYSSK